MKLIKRAWFLLIICIIGLINAGPVFAAKSIDISLYALPVMSEGIYGLVITYISNTQLDFEWSYAVNTNRVMIRGKYGSYPIDRNDGYQVYYGNNTTTSDTSMDFDNNPGPIYYSVWAQNTDDSWWEIVRQGQKESIVMTFLGYIFAAGILTYVAIKTPFRLFALLAGGAWLAFALYVKNNPPGNLTEGEPAHVALWVILVGVALAVPVYALGREVQVQKSFGDGLQVNKIFSKWNLGLGDIGRDKEKMSPVLLRRAKLQDYREMVHKSLFQPGIERRRRR